MEDSILEESEKSKGVSKYFTGKYKYLSYLLLALIIFGPFTYGFFSPDKDEDKNTLEKQEFTVRKTDLQISIPSDGRVVSNENIDLVFATAGIIDDIFVSEGQTVKKGDKIASLDLSELEFALNDALTAKQIALSNLLAKQAGATDTDIELSQKNITLAESHLEDVKKQNELDIKNAELALKTAELNLQAVQKEAESSSVLGGLSLEEIKLNIIQSYDAAVIKSAIALTEIEKSISEADKILGVINTSVNDDFEDVLGIKNTSLLNEVELIFKGIVEAKDEYITKYKETKIGSKQEEIQEKLNTITTIAKFVSQMLHKTSEVLENTITSANFSQFTLDAYKNSIQSQHEEIKEKVEELNNAKQVIDSAELNQKTEETSLLSIETSNEAKVEAAKQQKISAKLQLENIKIKAIVSENDAKNQLDIAQSQFSLKTEPIREVDIASLRAQISQAQNQVDEAEFKLGMATLVAPIDGRISNINFKKGEMFNDMSSIFASISNKNNFGIESYIEEIDITKINIAQKAYITLDAIEGAKLEAEVVNISDVPTIDINGIVTYLVKLAIIDTQEKPVKDGMTAYVDFIIKESKNVNAVPVAAVKRVGGKPSVQVNQDEWKEVSTGFTDGKMVEILSGLNSGDKIIYYE